MSGKRLIHIPTLKVSVITYSLTDIDRFKSSCPNVRVCWHEEFTSPGFFLFSINFEDFTHSMKFSSSKEFMVLDNEDI